MAAGRRPAAGPRSRAAMAQWRKKKGFRKRRGTASQARGSDSEDGEFEIQAEDDARAQKLGPGRPLPTFPTSECTSDVEPDTREMVRAQNKKKKKSGGFQSMGLSYPVFKGIMKKGYKVPTPIQRKTIPVILDGKDVVAMARTGSGKTACFLLPMFERLKTHSAQTGARALILSPTRELALQTLKFTKELGKFTGLKTALILGGDRMEDQFAALHENPDIIIATPGRLVHVAVEMNLKLQSVEYVVFDEADRLFEMGFAEQLQEIIARLPGGHQTVLFSATLPKLLVEFARAGLTEPVLIRLDVDTKLNEQLKTSFFLVREDTKAAVLLHLLRNVVRPQDQTVVFVATKHHAEYLTELLTTQRVSCAHIYSALDPTARKINLAKFTLGKCSALIVTDLAARGLDIPLLDNVINYSFPAKGKLFLHRVGRVARAGRSGTAYSLVAPDEIPYLLDLHLFLGRSLALARPLEDPSEWECMGQTTGITMASIYGPPTMGFHLQSCWFPGPVHILPHLSICAGGRAVSHLRFTDERTALTGLPTCTPQEGAAGVDGMLGRVPQSVVDEEDSGLQSTLEASLELRGLARVADNAQQQYVRSRPAPSPESIKRAKELDLVGLGLHPLFSSRFEEEELQRLRLVDSIKNYRSRATIFEINASSRDLCSQVMRAKRQKDHKAITRFQQGQQGRQEQQEGPVGPAPSCPALQEKQPEKEEEEEEAGESVEDIFSEVMGRKRQRSGPNRGAKRRREEAWQWDQEFYIPYRPKDFDSERGLSISGEGGAFEQQVAGAVLDLMGDEAQNLTRGRQQLKWDRKKKRFVGKSGQEDKKKIKTESGRYINSSYKRDLYQKWKQKQKIDDRDSDEEGASDRRGPERRGGKRGRGQGASRPHAPGTPAGCVRPELKTKQQILKQRRRAQKLRFLQRGGLKQLSARNRRRVQELQQAAFGRVARSKKGKMRKRM
ncbi:PREDICTED: ATP-dependent RNA helicase DDX54 isoform X2 [Cercocebus atys]|uniref:ATP-dependent RNA helicase DDX54 isoform X2 n=1 Tax=Cercocebus atys TaxID=9531 RepID=UPI0005F3D34F|nr:PREDICTED: ATP-dependent RNA helicase DDX54 isoform X2 [Cercocebus atys]